MKKEVLYSLKSPYREPLDVIGFRFGSGRKALALVGAMRGNEIQQMYVCSQVVQELKKLERRGELVPDCEILVIPCVNYYSMNIGKRFWTMDNTDINRMFPGYDLGETTQRIADGVFAQIQGYEYGIQLASFYQEGNFLPHVKMMDTGVYEPDMMKLFGMQFGILRTPRPYDTTTLNYNWQIWDTKAFSMYTNATDVIDRPSAQAAVMAVMRFMANTGMITHKVHAGYTTEIISENDIRQIHSGNSGVFTPLVSTGEYVEEGDLLARITDPLDGELVSEIRSDKTGIVYFEYDRPLINENTVCFKLIKD